MIKYFFSFLLIKQVCQNKVDIAVITDASTSVTARNYLKVKAFVVKLTEAFDVGRDRSHFAMIHYSWGAHLDFSFAEHKFWDATSLKNRIMASRYIYGMGQKLLITYILRDQFFLVNTIKKKKEI